MKKLILVLVILLLFPFLAFGQVITSCGASKGYSYFFEGGIVPKDKSGWSEDAISKGQMILVLEENGKEVNIYYKDAQTTKSAKEDGGKVHLMYIDDNLQTIIILVNYPGNGVIEHFMFRLDGKGNGSVVWGTDRTTSRYAKASLFKASCSKGNL
jgi:hypothetical protein